MNYHQLKEFLLHQMRMSHIYQPVMIKCLLQRGGAAEDVTIARDLLQYDPSQLEYYQQITNNMVGKVLRNRLVVEKEMKHYRLTAFNGLDKSEIADLIAICETKIDDYIAKRGDAIWQHRKKTRGYISGTIRYKVLKRAQFRCELCGIAASEKALEVDHILPVNLGGKDEEDNYQALCYSCNAMKRDTDATDFRNIREQYDHREKDCIFCLMESKRIVSENNLAFLIYDQYPVSDLHCLVIPKRHTSDYFSISQPEINAVNRLVQEGRELILERDKTVLGFNLGLNCGEAAGQTVMHTHLHLIPRRAGDTTVARGGVRNVIAGKGDYLL
jgi:ATP adenylyltransferase